MAARLCGPARARALAIRTREALGYIILALHKDSAKPALPENDTLPHQCDLCDWRFPNLAFLAYHIKAKHC